MSAPVRTDKAPAAIGPYSQGMISTGLVFTSGQLGIDPATGQMPGTVEEQARLALENLKAVLEEAGTSMGRVVKTTVFLSDMNNFAAVNAVYTAYFAEPFPARSCVEVARLPKDALVEVEAVAER
ncbi:RidA family protein [Desulfovibrio psychrotolerans]|nr:RidA family protein [Desulfovibrio psychrotolerans]